MRAKKINNLILQITEKSCKIRNAGATKGTRVEEKKRWFAPHDMALADDILEAIYDSITAMDRFIVVVSENSINSTWVEQEAKLALGEERRRQSLLVLPVQLDKTIVSTKVPWAALLRDTRKIGDFQRWYERDHYEEGLHWLLEALKAHRRSTMATK